MRSLPERRSWRKRLLVPPGNISGEIDCITRFAVGQTRDEPTDQR